MKSKEEIEKAARAKVEKEAKNKLESFGESEKDRKVIDNYWRYMNAKNKSDALYVLQKEIENQDLLNATKTTESDINNLKFAFRLISETVSEAKQYIKTINPSDNDLKRLIKRVASILITHKKIEDRLDNLDVEISFNEDNEFEHAFNFKLDGDNKKIQQPPNYHDIEIRINNGIEQLIKDHVKKQNETATDDKPKNSGGREKAITKNAIFYVKPKSELTDNCKNFLNDLKVQYKGCKKKDFNMMIAVLLEKNLLKPHSKKELKEAFETAIEPNTQSQANFDKYYNIDLTEDKNYKTFKNQITTIAEKNFMF